MKRFAALIFLCAFSLGLHAQAVNTTVCDVMKDPASFNGKTVQIKGTVEAGFDYFIVRDKNCEQQVNAIWLDYPEGTHGKAGPAALVQMQPARNYSGAPVPPPAPALKMDKNKDFKEFDSALSTPHKISGMCLGCNRYNVTATLVGRIDSVAKAGVKHDKTGKIVGIDGYGNLNAYPARLVLQSVSEVTPQEIDYSHSDPIAKEDKPDATKPVGLDPDAADTLHGYGSQGINMSLDLIQVIGGLNKAAAAFQPGSAAQVAIQRAAAAYGGKGEHSGINTGYGAPNEVSPKTEVAGSKESPDGVLFNCTFNTARLDDDAMSRAVIHAGEHIADLRKPPADGSIATYYDMEYQGWATTVLYAVGSRQHTLSLPGGYMLWYDGWPADQKESKLEHAIQDFLMNVEDLRR